MVFLKLNLKSELAEQVPCYITKDREINTNIVGFNDEVKVTSDYASVIIKLHTFAH